MTVIPAAGEAKAGRAKIQVLSALHSKVKVSLSSFGETLSQNKTWDEGAGSYNCMEFLPSMCGVLGSTPVQQTRSLKIPCPPGGCEATSHSDSDVASFVTNAAESLTIATPAIPYPQCLGLPLPVTPISALKTK